MVSTRGIKYRFTEGEKVLCYEPDTTKARVLYDSKVLGISEARDKRGRRIVQYKIHFQGWNSSWDRKVNSDLVLKDTEENRQLQKTLAEKAQLQLGAYLYRRDRKKRVQTEKVTTENSSSPSRKIRGSSEDNSSCSTLGKLEPEFGMKDDCDTESYASSTDSLHDDDRVVFKVGEKLKEILDFDNDMVVNHNKQHILPPRITAITILENFVKQSAIKLVCSSSQLDNPRRRSAQFKSTVEKKEKEYEKLFNTITLFKEVADALRIYLNFTVIDYLLYKNEKEAATFLLSETNLKNFTYVASLGPSPDILLSKSESDLLYNNENSENRLNNMSNKNDAHGNSAILDEPVRRKLRSCRSDDCDIVENCVSSKASNSSGSSTPYTASFNSNSLDFIKSFTSTNLGMPVQIKEFLQKVLSWQLLPTNSEAEPSMMFGATHLARLIIKLPDFFNASTTNDDKLKIILQHLDSFVLYLESHKEWFTEDNYFKLN